MSDEISEVARAIEESGKFSVGVIPVGTILYSGVKFESPEKPWNMEDKLLGTKALDLMWLTESLAYAMEYVFTFVLEDVEGSDEERIVRPANYMCKFKIREPHFFLIGRDGTDPAEVSRYTQYNICKYLSEIGNELSFVGKDRTLAGWARREHDSRSIINSQQFKEVALKDKSAVEYIGCHELDLLVTGKPRDRVEKSRAHYRSYIEKFSADQFEDAFRLLPRNGMNTLNNFTSPGR